MRASKVPLWSQARGKWSSLAWFGPSSQPRSPHNVRACSGLKLNSVHRLELTAAQWIFHGELWVPGCKRKVNTTKSYLSYHYKGYTDHLWWFAHRELSKKLHFLSALQSFMLFLMSIFQFLSDYSLRSLWRPKLTKRDILKAICFAATTWPKKKKTGIAGIIYRNGRFKNENLNPVGLSWCTVR